MHSRPGRHLAYKLACLKHMGTPWNNDSDNEPAKLVFTKTVSFHQEV
jgi:hypothetical protein